MGYEYDDPRREAMEERMKLGIGLCSGERYYRDRRKALGGPRTYRIDGGKIR